MKNPLCLRLALASAFLVCAASAAPPDDFPVFTVPGQERAMNTVRELFWLHYPGSGPKSTLWDEWLPDASLWPAVTSENHSDQMRAAWRRVLSERIMDSEGYVATHQHASIAHQLGWPFPFWNQGRRGFGWHFSFKNTVDANWRPHDLSKPDGWSLAGGRAVAVEEAGWALEITNTRAVLTPPPWKCHTFEVPFVQLRWQVEGFKTLEPWIEWTTVGETNFSSQRRLHIEPPPAGQMTYTMVPMYRHPAWTGEVNQVRIGFGNNSAGKVVLQAMFSQYDTRHNINEQNFIRGCAKYFWWTRDLSFLRANLQRMRTALRYTMTEHQALDQKVVRTTWVGHDGRSGLQRSPNGSKEIFTGRGIGNNYWDLLPFGNLDCYATIQYYDALQTMAVLEREVRAHPEWQMPLGVLALDPEMLEAHAADVKAEGNRRFWNAKTGRFVACIDVDGKAYDYGLTFLNLEAVHYDFATAEHARTIMQWVDGDRMVEGDTSQGKDIYFWRFAPRATTRRNLEWYFWAWNAPESIPWGGQVQDGGAVLGFSYHDLMARLKTLGPDNTWQRLTNILGWFEEVQAVGGYRKYYNGSRPGSMQGGGTAGGLGLDQEFFESAMVPQVMLYGFLGFAPRADGFRLDPRLPSQWPELGIQRIRYQNQEIVIRCSRDFIELKNRTVSDEPVFVLLPKGEWRAAWCESETVTRQQPLRMRARDHAAELSWKSPGTWRLERAKNKTRPISRKFRRPMV